MDLIRIFGERSIVQRNWIRFKNQTNNNEFSKRERKHMFPLFWQKQKKMYRILVRIKTHTQIWSFFSLVSLSFWLLFADSPAHPFTSICIYIKLFFSFLFPISRLSSCLIYFFNFGYIFALLPSRSFGWRARATERYFEYFIVCYTSKTPSTNIRSLTHSMSLSLDHI